MTPNVNLSDETFEKLKKLAVPLEDSVDSVVSRIADMALELGLSITDVDLGAGRNIPLKAEMGTDLSGWRRRFWAEILEYIAAKQPPFRVQSPPDDSWTVISIGRSGFRILLTLTPKRGRIGCELYFDVPWKDRAFDLLLQDRENIETELGNRLNWNAKPGKKSCSLYLEAEIDPADASNREGIKKWMYEQSLKFYEVFRERVMRLDSEK